MARAYSKAQAEASRQYQRKLSGIAIKVKPEQRDRYNAAAEAAGISLRQLILRALEEKIERDHLL